MFGQWVFGRKSPNGRHKAAGLHCSGRRHGRGVAACGARAADWSGCGGSACSCPQQQTMRNSDPRRGVPERPPAIGLDHRPKHADRHPLGHDQCRSKFADYAAELVALEPDVILAASSPALAALQQATRTVPIVFMQCHRSGRQRLVDSLTRPGGNTTGFMLIRIRDLSGKWLELLKQIAPNVTRAAVFRDTGNPSGNG